LLTLFLVLGSIVLGGIGIVLGGIGVVLTLVVFAL